MIEERKKALASLNSKDSINFKPKGKAKAVVYVFTDIGNNQFQMNEVKAGVKNEGFCQIISNELDNSSKIVVKNAYSLLGKLMNKSE